MSTEEMNNAHLRIAAAKAYANNRQFGMALKELAIAEDSYRLASGARDRPLDGEATQQYVADELASVRVQIESRKDETD